MNDFKKNKIKGTVDNMWQNKKHETLHIAIE